MQRRMLNEAKEDADALKDNSNARSTLNRFHYLWQIGDQETALRELREAAAREGSRDLAYQLALALYQQDNIEDALKALDPRNQPDEDANAILRIFLLAEQSGDSRQPYEDFLKLADRRRHESGQPITHWSTPAVLLFLGKRAEAAECARGNASFANRDRLADFLEGNKLSAEAFLDDARNSRYLKCGHYYWIGMARLSEGDREGAKAAFKASANSGLWSVFYQPHSRIMLERLERDPTWPRWIPAKK
jgi:hypothetical protein